MQIAQVMANYTLANADLLRRAMGKKKQAEMDKQREIFIQGSIANGVTEEVASSVFDLMDKFSQYGFNKSHSAAYAILSYQLGYFKHFYPAQFYAAAIDREDKPEVRDALIREARNVNVEVGNPCVNESGINFEVVPRGIRFGLGSIKKVGSQAQRVIEERKKGDFNSFEDFVMRTLMRKDALQSLIKAGALDNISSHSRAAMHDCAEDFLSNERKRRDFYRKKRKSDVDMFKVEKIPEWNNKTKMFYELESAGTFISGHPLGVYQHLAEALAKYNTFKLQGDDYKVIVGSVVSVERKLSKKGNLFYIVGVLDGSLEKQELIVFESIFNQYETFLREESDILVMASKYQGKYSTIKAVQPLDEAIEEWITVASIRLDSLEDLGKLELSLSEYKDESGTVIIGKLDDSDFVLPDSYRLSSDLMRTLDKMDVSLF